MAVFLARGSTSSLEPIKGRVDLMQSKADPELAAAVLRARKELPNFISALNSPKPGQVKFALNARFKSASGFEHMWVKVDRYSGGVFEGTLAEEPYEIPTQHKGDAVKVPEDTVNDWTFMDGERIAGGYTTQVLLKRRRESAKSTGG